MFYSTHFNSFIQSPTKMFIFQHSRMKVPSHRELERMFDRTTPPDSARLRTTPPPPHDGRLRTTPHDSARLRTTPPHFDGVTPTHRRSDSSASSARLRTTPPPPHRRSDSYASSARLRTTPPPPHRRSDSSASSA